MMWGKPNGRGAGLQNRITRFNSAAPFQIAVAQVGKPVLAKYKRTGARRSPADPEGELSDGHIGERIVQVLE